MVTLSSLKLTKPSCISCARIASARTVRPLTSAVERKASVKPAAFSRIKTLLFPTPERVAVTVPPRAVMSAFTVPLMAFPVAGTVIIVSTLSMVTMTCSPACAVPEKVSSARSSVARPEPSFLRTSLEVVTFPER